MFPQACVVPSVQGGGILHPGGGVCIQGAGQTPPSDTTGYGHRAGGVHPIGMHFVLNIFFGKDKLTK